MIQVYCVFFMGEPLLLGEDAQELGFYRNEYVLSTSVDGAVKAAKAKTIKRLEQKAIRFIEGKPFALSVEKVKPGIPPWRLLRSEGFLFFPADEADSQS